MGSSTKMFLGSTQNARFYTTTRGCAAVSLLGPRAVGRLLHWSKQVLPTSHAFWLASLLPFPTGPSTLLVFCIFRPQRLCTCSFYCLKIFPKALHKLILVLLGSQPR